MQTNTVLTIAGFDPTSGAGVTADLKVFAAHGHFGTACITALTVQNTLGVFATQAIATDTVSATLEAIASDIPPAGIKIGMLANAGNVVAVARFLSRIRRERPVIVVLDPVLKSSSGSELLDPDGVRAMLSDLLPLVDWITPNRNELQALLGEKSSEMSNIPADARSLQQLGQDLHVVVTGGHADPPTDILLQPAHSAEFIEGARVETTSTHGTGCAFSSALLSHLVLGLDPLPATRAAKAYVTQALSAAVPIGAGHGPLHHLWPVTIKTTQR